MTMPIATKYRSGLMGAADKAKVDGLPAANAADAGKLLLVNSSGTGVEVAGQAADPADLEELAATLRLQV